MPREGAGVTDIPWVGTAEMARALGMHRLALRLGGLRDAVEMGAPLSTGEGLLLLGARPAGERVTRAGIEGRREARGLWRVAKASERRERW